jgi:hypothetical protein
MRITLPSGAWIDVKDNTLQGDRFAIQDSVDLVVEDGKTVIHGAQSAQWRAFLSRVILAWSYDVPIPSVGGVAVLDEHPTTDDDIDALDDALAARFNRIVGRRGSPNRQRQPSSTSPT